MRIRATMMGSLEEQAKAGRDTLAKAVSIAIAGATEGAKLELRRQLPGGKFDRFRNAIQSRVYPKLPHFSMTAAGTVFAAGAAADRAFSAFSTGAVVTPKGARALAIPLHNYRGIDKRLLGPKSSYFAGRLHFIPSARRSRGLTVGILATRAAGRPSEIRKQLRTKGRARVAEHLVGDWIPQFVLVRSVRLPKLLSPEAAIAKWTAQIPALIEAALTEIREA